MAHRYSCSCLFNNINFNNRYTVMNNFIIIPLDPFENLCNRKFGHFSASEIKQKITEIENKGDEKTCRDMTVLDYLKRKLI